MKRVMEGEGGESDEEKGVRIEPEKERGREAERKTERQRDPEFVSGKH